MWDVRRLRLLRELHVRGTIAAVAVALHQSPSSVSQQLTQLEREVGLPLLRKSGRGVVLTPQADILVEHTEAILARLELAQSEVLASMDEPTGTLRLAIFQSAALALVPRTLAHLRAHHPRLRLTVTQREPEAALLDTFVRDFDIVVAEQYPGHAAPWHRDLDRDPLIRDAIQLAVPARWRQLACLADAAGLPWVAEPPGTASRHFLEQACRQAGFDPDVQFETADLQVHVALIASGNAVTVMPELMWHEQANPSIRLIDLPGAPRRTVFTAARRSTAADPSVVATRQALTEAAQLLSLGS